MVKILDTCAALERFEWRRDVFATDGRVLSAACEHLALLSIAESLLTPQPPRPRPDPTGAVGQQHGELLTVAEVAEMTRLSVGTLRWWRAVRRWERGGVLCAEIERAGSLEAWCEHRDVRRRPGQP